MAWQKGPGEGYGAAKDDVLALRPKWRCRAVYYGGGGRGYATVEGYVVENEDGKTMGSGRISRDAWGAALGKIPEWTLPYKR